MCNLRLIHQSSNRLVSFSSGDGNPSFMRARVDLRVVVCR